MESEKLKMRDQLQSLVKARGYTTLDWLENGTNHITCIILGDW